MAGNYFKFAIFYGADFIFGSIFAMLALQLFGIGRGIIAALFLNSILFLIWGHHYATIIMTAEVAVVGWLNGRRKLGYIQADTLYWLFIGMPLVYLSYHLIMKTSQSGTLFIMAKDMLNGVANILVARLIFTAFTLRSHRSPISYREAVYNLLASFVLCPTLILVAAGSRTDFNETDRHARTTLIHDIRRLTDRVDTWVVNRKSAIIHLAEMAASRSPQQMQPCLEQATQSDINFLRIGLLDREAHSTAFFPLFDELGHHNIGINFADRPFIPALKQTLKPMLSEVVMSRIGTPTPVVLMLAPVGIRGGYGGYVAGTLTLKQIGQHLDKSTDEFASLYTLLDKNGNVIMTNRTDQKILTPFNRGKGTLNHLDAGISQWVPSLLPNTPVTERWENSFYTADSAIGDLAEWRLILEQPVAPFQKALFNKYSKIIAFVLLLLIVSLVVAEVLSRRMMLSLEELGVLTQDLPIKLASDGQAIHWPESGIQESNQLISNFKLMAGSLSEQFNKVREINESLERRVDQRTQELTASEEKFRTVADYTYDWEIWEDPKGTILYCSPSCQRLTGYSAETFKADSGLMERLIHPEDLARWKAHYATTHERPGPLDSAPESAQQLDFRILRPDGGLLWISHICHPISDSKGHSLGRRISNRDITERQLAGEARLKAEGQVQRALDNVFVGCMIIGFDWTYLYVNEVAAQHGHQVREKLIGSTMLELYPGVENSPIFAAYRRCMEDRVNQRFEANFAFPDGTTEWYEFNVDPAPEGIFVLSLDITKRKEDEARMTILAQELEQKNQEMEETLYAASHDLRAPLLNVRGFTDMVSAAFGRVRDRMRNQDVPPAVQGDLEPILAQEIPSALHFIETGVEKLDALINGLLAVSRAGREVLHFETVDMAGLMGRVQNAMTFQLQEADARVEVGELPPCLGDASALNRVFANLLDNALKYRRPDRPPHIRVTGRMEAGRCFYCVEDNGIGIDPRHHDRIWRLFHRLDPKGPTKGEGLGLTLVHRILNRLHGRAWVESVPETEGTGCRFHVELPASSSEAPTKWTG